MSCNVCFPVENSTNQINTTTMQTTSRTSQVVTKTTIIQVTSTTSQVSTANPIMPTIQTTSTTEVVTLNSAATETTIGEFTVTTTVNLTTGVVMTTMPSQTMQIISWPQAIPSSVTLMSSRSSIPVPLSVTKATNARTDVLVSISKWLPQTMNYVANTETKQLSPSTTPTNTPNMNTSVPDDIEVILLYPPKDETITVTVTQSDVSTMLNCTISGSNLASIDMLWTHNNQPLKNHFTEVLNGHKVSYALAEQPGVYECILQSRNGVMSSQIAGTFEIIMSGN